MDCIEEKIGSENLNAPPPNLPLEKRGGADSQYDKLCAKFVLISSPFSRGRQGGDAFKNYAAANKIFLVTSAVISAFSPKGFGLWRITLSTNAGIELPSKP